MNLRVIPSAPARLPHRMSSAPGLRTAKVRSTELDQVELSSRPASKSGPLAKTALALGLAAVGVGLLGAAQPAMATDVSQLYGKVEVVEHFGDYKVKVVESFPDLRVKKVDHFADSPGEWEMVDHFGDFTIEFVDHFPDFTIKWVDHFPGP